MVGFGNVEVISNVEKNSLGKLEGYSLSVMGSRENVRWEFVF